MLITHPVTTTKKSIMFQTFLRYDPLCKTKPKAKIFNEASTQNIPKKYASVLSCNKKHYRHESLLPYNSEELTPLEMNKK